MNRRRREASAGVRSKKCGENNNNLTKLGLAAREGITNGFTNRESESFTVYGFSQITVHSYDVTTSKSHVDLPSLLPVALSAHSTAACSSAW